MKIATSDGEQNQFMSVPELIDKWAEDTPDAVFLVDSHSDTQITYQMLKSQASAVAHNISSCGVKAGESVAYAMSNNPQTAVTVLGILYGGFLATSINLVAGRDTISYVLEHSEAKLVLANAMGEELVSSVQSEVAVMRCIIVVDEGFLVAPDQLQPKSITAETDGLLMYTSGTTGRPKGVVLSHKNLIAGGRNTALAHQLANQDRGMCILPLYHINGLCVTVMGALVSGGSLVVPHRFSVSSFWQTIVKQQITWFSAVPTQISYLLHYKGKIPPKEQLVNVGFARSASAPLSPDVQEAFEARFGIPIVETMGLTETAAQILSNPLPPGVRKIGSPGVAFGNEVIIADENQREVRRGKEGEVLVRGQNIMRCYLKNEAATVQALTADGWLRTGDLGRMDDDGYVFITGRLKELIIKGGENIAPREVDEALYSHSDVVEAAAFSRKCDRYGETVEAAVMVCEGSKATEAELIEMCVSRLGNFKAPERVHFLPELPKGPSGKIQRIKLLNLVMSEAAQDRTD